jgi:hypothetical protein
MKFFIPTFTEKTINADEVFRIITEYTRLFHIMEKIVKKKAVTELRNHMSGIEVQSTMIVPVRYDIHSRTVVSNYFMVSTINKDLENGWIALRKSNTGHLHPHIDIEDFFKLPDWTEEDVPTITSKIVDQQ